MGSASHVMAIILTLVCFVKWHSVTWRSLSICPYGWVMTASRARVLFRAGLRTPGAVAEAGEEVGTHG